MINIKDLQIEEIEGEDIRSEYVLYSSSGEDFFYQMAEDEAFYLGNQLTEAQKEYLVSVGQPPIRRLSSVAMITKTTLSRSTLTTCPGMARVTSRPR